MTDSIVVERVRANRESGRTRTATARRLTVAPADVWAVSHASAESTGVGNRRRSPSRARPHLPRPAHVPMLECGRISHDALAALLMRQIDSARTRLRVMHLVLGCSPRMWD